MIRTALLAGLLIVVAAIAINRPGILTEAAHTAASVAEDQTRKAVNAIAAPTPEPVQAKVTQAMPAPVPAAPIAASLPPVPPAAQVTAAMADPSPAPVASAPRNPQQATAAIDPRQRPFVLEPAQPVEVVARPVRVPNEFAPPVARTDNARVATPTAAVDDVAPRVDTAKFMTARERSRELYRLAREMETVFTDKIVR